jgi:hypothetical protein
MIDVPKIAVPKELLVLDSPILVNYPRITLHYKYYLIILIYAR